MNVRVHIIVQLESLPGDTPQRIEAELVELVRNHITLQRGYGHQEVHARARQVDTQ